MLISFYLCSCSGQGMLPTEESFFKNGKVNKEALVDFIKTIKKNTNLSDEDAAIMAASKVFLHWSLLELDNSVYKIDVYSYRIPIIAASQALCIFPEWQPSSLWNVLFEFHEEDCMWCVRWWIAGRRRGSGTGSTQRGTWPEAGRSNQPSRWTTNLKRWGNEAFFRSFFLDVKNNV